MGAAAGRRDADTAHNNHQRKQDGPDTTCDPSPAGGAHARCERATPPKGKGAPAGHSLHSLSAVRSVRSPKVPAGHGVPAAEP